MAGLMTATSAQAAQPPPQRGLMPPPGEAQANVSPEEQKLYEMTVRNALTLVYDEKAMPSILQSLQGGGNPVAGLADTAAMVMARVEESAAEAGQQLSGDILLHAGTEVLEDLANLAREAGVYEFSEEDTESALYQAMDRYRQMKADKGELDGGVFQQDMAQLEQMNQSGELDREFPGLAEHFTKRQQGAA